MSDGPPSDRAPSGARRFDLRFDDRYRMLALPFGVTPATAWVHVGGEVFEARFGPWRVRTPASNVAGAEVTGPYGLLRTAGGARLSFADRGLTFATNGDRGVCIQFHEPVHGMAPVGPLRHPGLTVTVADVEGLRKAIDALV